MSDAIRVLIVDDHAVVRAGLRLLLDAEEDIEVVGEAGNGRQAIFATIENKPDGFSQVLLESQSSAQDATPRRTWR